MPQDTLSKLVAQPMEHQSKRVITLPQMDEVHSRPAGTARGAFNRNRKHMVKGRHFFVAPAYGKRTPDGRLSGATEIVLLTEHGYLMLVKSFHDDLAWQVQEELIDGYFRAKAAPTQTQRDLLNLDFFKNFAVALREQEKLGGAEKAKLAGCARKSGKALLVYANLPAKLVLKVLPKRLGVFHKHARRPFIHEYVVHA